MSEDPYSDAIFQEFTPLNAVNPPHRNAVFKEFLTSKDREMALFRHQFEEKVEFRSDKKILLAQKVSFIPATGTGTAASEWSNNSQICIEKAEFFSLKLHKYCLKMINDRLHSAKQKIADLDAASLATARGLANPYEGVGTCIFMNRYCAAFLLSFFDLSNYSTAIGCSAAVKMASLDHMYSLIDPSVKKSLVFADLCGGPGGFTEYLNWRCQQYKMSCKGFGVTLKGNQDWDMYSFKAIKPNSMDFKTHYGVDGSGDLYNIETAKSLSDLVFKDTKNEGVDLVVADGGFSVKGDESYQEEHFKLLFVAQTLAMLRILKKGGTFVLKVFDLLTEFSVDLVYLLYLHFEGISICKPFASRPANSERYLVCRKLKEAAPKDLIDFLERVQKQLVALKPSGDIAAKSGHVKHQPGFIRKQEKVDLGLLDMHRLLDQDFVARDEVFVDAIEGSNMKLATKQKDALEDLYLYAKNSSLLPYDQESIAKACCKEWRIPYN